MTDILTLDSRLIQPILCALDFDVKTLNPKIKDLANLTCRFRIKDILDELILIIIVVIKLLFETDILLCFCVTTHS